jgi:hypothetical protein
MLKKAGGSKQESASNKLIKERGRAKKAHFLGRWINSCESGTEFFSERRLGQ